VATSLNDTSGTVGQTVLDVAELIEHAARRCGVSASVLTAEQLRSARINLFLILSNLATRGLSLWCVQKMTFGLTAGRAVYALPVGTIDTLKMLYRNPSVTYSAAGPAAGALSTTLATPAVVSSAVATPAVPGVYSFVLESSNDGVTWAIVGGPTTVNFYDYPVGVDATTLREALFWRIRDTSDPARNLSSATFFSNVNEFVVSKMSRDDYTALPNKAITSQWPLQFWYDKQFYRPQVTFWPVSARDASACVFIQRQIQDPGSYTNAVEVPQRWLDTVISLLAPRVFLELPKELVDPSRYQVLKDVAAETLRDAEDSETDGAPIRLSPNIGCYTR